MALNTIKRLRALRLGKSYPISWKGHPASALVTDIRPFGKGYTIFFDLALPRRKRTTEERRGLKQFERMIAEAERMIAEGLNKTKN